jgi:hypothetical protein
VLDLLRRALKEEQKGGSREMWRQVFVEIAKLLAEQVVEPFDRQPVLMLAQVLSKDQILAN